MRIKRFGIQLKSLEAEQIETLRNWRNSDRNRMAMQFDKIIEPEEQIHWFENIDFEKNLLFIYSLENQDQGFIQLKNIDLRTKEAEAGIIHGEESTLGTTIPMIAIICMMEFAFDVLGLEKLLAKIKTGNKPVELLNQNLGYRKAEQQLNSNYSYYQVSKQKFELATFKYKTMLKNANGANFKVDLDRTEGDSFWQAHFQSHETFTLIDSAHFKTAF